MPYKKREISKQFGRNLKKFREERGITQDALAEVMGLTKPTISKYENAQATAPIQFVFELAEKYGVKPDMFVKEDEKEEEK